MLSGVLRLIANRLLLPRLLPKRARSQAPFLHRSYPASSVVRACPTPDLAATQVVTFGVATPARDRASPDVSCCLVNVPCPLPRRIRTGAHVRFPSPFDAAFPVTQ